MTKVEIQLISLTKRLKASLIKETNRAITGKIKSKCSVDDLSILCLSDVAELINMYNLTLLKKYEKAYGIFEDMDTFLRDSVNEQFSDYLEKISGNYPVNTTEIKRDWHEIDKR